MTLVKPLMTIEFDDSARLLAEHHLIAENAYLRAQLDQAHADGAVMRDALESMLKASQGFQRMKAYPKAHDALSSSCGADLLARYREAVDLLGYCSVSNGKLFTTILLTDEWIRRRDTLLATVPKL